MHRRNGLQLQPCGKLSADNCEYLSCLVFGCTQLSACNYDPDANADNGTCEFASCLPCLTTAVIDSVNLSGGQAGESPIQFVASGSVESLDIVLTFANVTNDASWAADAAVLIQPPGQPCYVLGGFDTDSNCVSVAFTTRLGPPGQPAFQERTPPKSLWTASIFLEMGFGPSTF